MTIFDDLAQRMSSRSLLEAYPTTAKPCLKAMSAETIEIDIDADKPQRKRYLPNAII